MRWIVLSFFVLSLKVFSGEPSDIALAFIRGLSEEVSKSDLSKELAISPFCGPEKRDRIDELWKRRGHWSESGKFEFAPINEKIDHDFAGVIIGATSPDGPDTAAVLSLGLIKKGERWQLAPLEGSFDNTGLGFGAEIKSRMSGLERWMALQRVKAMTGLTRSELARFRKKMGGAVSPRDLALDDPKEVLLNFIEAAENKETNALIVWQGFLERDQLPDRDWDQHLRATRRGMAGKDKQRIWRVLGSRKVMKVIIEENLDEEEEAGFMVGFLSSYETEPMDERLNPVRFSLYRTEQGWRVSLPAYFSFADEESREFRSARNDEFDWEDRRGVKQMFEVFEDAHEQKKSPDPATVLKAVLEDLKNEGLTPFLQRLYREKEKVEKPDDQEAVDDELELRVPQPNGGRWRANDFDDRRMGHYMQAVKWWGETLKGRDTIKAELTKVYVEEQIALGLLSLPTSGESWKPVYRKIWMSHDGDGWVVLPGGEVPLRNSYPPERQEVVQKMVDEFTKDAAKMEDEFLVNVLKVVGLANPEGTAASEELAKTLVNEWRQTATDGTMINLLKVSAVRKLPAKPTKLLRDLGFIRKGAGIAASPDEILGSKAAGRFRGVSLRVDSGGGSEMSYPLMIVAPSEDRYRVLVDIELPFETNKGIRLLNDDRMDDLAKEMSKEDLATIETLREWHQGLSKPVWEKWKLEQAESKE